MLPDEVTRRLVHASGTAVPLSYLLLESPLGAATAWRLVRALLLFGLVVATVLEVVRLYVGLDWWIYEKLTREYEQDNPAGYFLGVLGLAAVALAFEPSIGVPAMLMLTIADPFSGLLSSGGLEGAKQLWVLAATFGLATLLAAPFVPPTAAILGGLATAVADGVKPVVRGYVIDDNISIPVAAGVAMFVAVEFLPAFPQ